MIKGLLKIVAGSLLIMGVVLGMSFMSLEGAGAQSPQASACEGSGGVWANGACTTPNDNRTVTGTISQVANIMIFVIGAVAVLMIIIGGLRYVLAQGDSSATKSAKDTILFAIIGLVISIAAYGLVNFVTSQFS